MVALRLRLGVLLAVGTGAAGCQDTTTVDPYPGSWLIDDFEASNGTPADPNFERWGCRPWDDQHPIEAEGCNVIPDPGSHAGVASNVLHLGTALYPLMPDDTFTRAEVLTWVRQAHILDLRPYRTLVLSWRIALMSDVAESLAVTSGQSKRTIVLASQLLCTRTQPAAGSESGYYMPWIVFRDVVPVDEGSSWNRAHSIDISAFGPSEKSTMFSLPVWQKAAWVQDCLAQVDGIKITVDSNGAVLSGHTVPFDLYVDDILLQPRE